LWMALSRSQFQRPPSEPWSKSDQLCKLRDTRLSPSKYLSKK
jgi:hypothetical protein